MKGINSMTELEIKLKETLNTNQFEAAMHMDGPAVIMAGAGSGKTHTLMNRVAHLVDSGVSPEQILMLTFTNAAADEMKSRSSQLLDERCSKILASTYHSFCTLMLRKYGRSIGLKDFQVLSPSENRNMISYVKSSNPAYDNLKGFPSAKVLESVFSMSINKQMSIKTILASEEKYSKYYDWHDEIQMLADEVAAYSYRENKFNYDDLLLYMNKMLSEEDAITRMIAAQYRYIMIDEFQDTNNLQESMILKLANYNKNIVVVGDISQSIYAFRGANVRNLQKFNQKLENCKTIVLDNNYRSTQEILDAANSVMNHNVNSWKYYNMVAPVSRGSKPVLKNVADSSKEAETVFGLIEYYHNQGVAYKDMAVLERNSNSSYELENMLSNATIKFNKMGGQKFMDLDCVGDVLSYFRIITNPHDLLSWYRVLQLHPFIGDKFAKEIANLCDKEDFLIENEYKSRKLYSELVLLNNTYKQFRTYTNFAMLFDAIVDFYFSVRERAVATSRMNDENKEAAEMQIASDKISIKILKNMSEKYDDIVRFVDAIILDSASQDDLVDADALTISTIHSAKGLEWDVVIIMDCVEGVFPMKILPSEYGTDKDEEELRCFYVAMTRAKNKLHLMVPKVGFVGGQFGNVCMSHYLNGSTNCFVN